MLAKVISLVICLAGAIASASQGPPQPESHTFLDEDRQLRLDSAKTQWDFYDGSNSNQEGPEFIARSPYILKNTNQPTLTLRVDRGEWRSSKHYAEKWLKDYPKFGFDLEMSREARYGNLHGFEMELKATSSGRKVRQFVSKQNQEIWVFTCSADKNHFNLAWKDCEAILKTATLLK